MSRRNTIYAIVIFLDALNQESAQGLHSRAAPSVEAHHPVNGLDTGRNSGGRRIQNFVQFVWDRRKLFGAKGSLSIQVKYIFFCRHDSQKTYSYFHFLSVCLFVCFSVCLLFLNYHLLTLFLLTSFFLFCLTILS